MAKTVCVAFGLGCPRAKVDTDFLSDYFDANHWGVTESIEKADLVVVNCCGFDAAWEQSSLRLLGAADRRRKQGSVLAVVGCLANTGESTLLKEFEAVVVPPQDMKLLDDLIDARCPRR